MSNQAAQARRHLDEALQPFRAAGAVARPPRGWVRAVRDALGMTSRQLAARLGIAQPTLVALERGEADGTITLNRLRQAAAALDCRLVYAIVPNRPLDEALRLRARRLAASQLARVHHSMRLEDQSLPDSALAQELERLTDELLATGGRRLWSDP